MDAPYLSHSFLSLFVLFSKYVFGPGFLNACSGLGILSLIMLIERWVCPVSNRKLILVLQWGLIRNVSRKLPSETLASILNNHHRSNPAINVGKWETIF